MRGTANEYAAGVRKIRKRSDRNILGFQFGLYQVVCPIELFTYIVVSLTLLL